MMRRAAGAIVLGLSACGYPLTQFVVRRWGMRGAAVAESVSVGLAIRDASMVASGIPGRLRRVPAALLGLELVAGVVVSLAPPPAAHQGSRAVGLGAGAEGLWLRPRPVLWLVSSPARQLVRLAPGKGAKMAYPAKVCGPRRSPGWHPSRSARIGRPRLPGEPPKGGE